MKGKVRSRIIDRKKNSYNNNNNFPSDRGTLFYRQIGLNPTPS